MAADTDPALDQAARIAAHLAAIQKVLRDSIWAQARRYPVPLTPPQVLVDNMRETAVPGLSLTELSARMGLAHSTVSGIVTMLEQRGLLRRTTATDDRRFTRIELSQPARDWVQNDLPASRLRPLVTAIGQAPGDELAAILAGLAALERLLSKAGRAC
jgi:DNA-binding MarR family transcriptional regulator